MIWPLSMEGITADLDSTTAEPFIQGRPYCRPHPDYYSTRCNLVVLISIDPPYLAPPISVEAPPLIVVETEKKFRKNGNFEKRTKPLKSSKSELSEYIHTS